MRAFVFIVMFSMGGFINEWFKTEPNWDLAFFHAFSVMFAITFYEFWIKFFWEKQ